METDTQVRADRTFLFFTIPTAVLIFVCSGIGVFYQNLYVMETTDWLSQTLGQDLSNLIVVVPALLISSFFAAKGRPEGKIIWLGLMLTNIYTYMIYAFAVHFNFLFHLYCIILGLSLYSVIWFGMSQIRTDFKVWFTEKMPAKFGGIFLAILALLFALLWLSDSLPAVLNGTVPESLVKSGLLTNPVQALDFSFYLPLMFLSALMILRKQPIGYLMVPVMITFATMTCVNIMALMLVSMVITGGNAWAMIGGFAVLTLVCILLLQAMLSKLKKTA